MPLREEDITPLTATPDWQLARELADPRVGKTEREHYAARRIAEVDSLLLAALCQGAHVDTDGYIDTCHLSTWDEIAEYLEEHGTLVRTEHGYRRAGA